MSTEPDGDQTLLPVPVRLHRPVVECLDCGAPLTDPLSRLWGRGPTCRQGLTSAPTPSPHTVDQDTLPDPKEPS